MNTDKGIKIIPESELNPIYSLPIEERSCLVSTILIELNQVTPDIKYFDVEIDSESDWDKAERYWNGK